jgi:hypothetical protein
MSKAEGLPVVDHPAQLGWQPTGLRAANEYLQALLRERFAAAGEDVQALMQHLDVAALQLDSYRLTHESDNLGRLRLTALGRRMYDRLAGRPEHFGEYIRWFGQMATRALLRDDHVYGFDSVSLELAGRRQLGDWGAARQLEIAMRRVPGQLHALDTDIAVVSPAARKSNYQLRPMYGDDAANYRFRYAGVRRRQPVLDVQERAQRQVRIYRQSVGLLVLGQLAPESQRSIVEAYEAAGPEQSAINNTLAATIAGQVFERAITDRTASAIVPIGTQYIMRVGQTFPEQRRNISQTDT